MEMANLTKVKSQTVNVAAARGTEIDNILGAAKEDAGFEKLIKFRKGDFSIGEEAVPLGTEYIAHAIGWTKCWIKFVEGEVVERKVYRVALGERPPEREDLDDLNKDNWPEGIDGKPADPWTLQYLLPLESVADGQVVIFTTSSIGGRRAVADLCAAYAKRKGKSATCGQPKVQLAKAEMPTKKFGRVPRPQFEIVGWDDSASDFDEAPPALIPEGDFDDSIPF
jgi:hypothetical protein